MKYTNELLMMNSNIEGLLENLNDAQLEQVGGGNVKETVPSTAPNGRVPKPYNPEMVKKLRF